MMESIEKWLLYSFFPFFIGIATMIGVIGMVLAISILLEKIFAVGTDIFFICTLIFGTVLYVYLKSRAIKKRVKKLVDTEAMNIAMAGTEPGNINRDLCGIIARRIYMKLCSEGFAKELQAGKTTKVYDMVHNAILRKYDFVKKIR